MGDAIEIVPQGIASRVRGLQIHGEKVKEAAAGSRVAVNLVGVEVEAMERGAQLAPPGRLAPTQTFDATLKLLPDLAKPLKDRARVRIHLGTSEIIGRLRLLDNQETLEANGTAAVQFKGETEFACARGDRFVVRTYSPMQTIGGGVVLDSAPGRHKKNDVATLESLAARERGTPEDLLETLLLRHPVGLMKKDLPSAGLTAEDTETGLNSLIGSGKAVFIGNDRIILASSLQSLTDRGQSLIQAYHAQFPLRGGIPKEELRIALGRDMDNRAFAALLSHWQLQNVAIIEANLARLVHFVVQLNERQAALLDRLAAYYAECGIATPEITDVARMIQAPPDAVHALLRVGVERGRFARVAEDIYYDAQTLAKLQNLVRTVVVQNGSITVAQFRDLTQSNRKFALQALEYFDRVRFTRRTGDERTLFTDETA